MHRGPIPCSWLVPSALTSIVGWLRPAARDGSPQEASRLSKARSSTRLRSATLAFASAEASGPNACSQRKQQGGSIPRERLPPYGHSGKLRRLSGCSPSASVLRYSFPYPVSTDGDDHLHSLATPGDLEGPLPALNTSDGFFLRQRPRPICVSGPGFAAYPSNSFVRILPIRLVDAGYFVRHRSTP